MTIETEEKVLEQRGKRKTARYTEVVLFLIILASLWGVPHAFEVLKLVLIPALAYAASLRGLDAYFK